MKEAAVATTLWLALACQGSGQVHDKFENSCDSLQNATAPDLVQFLDRVTPDEKNGQCVAWAIHTIGTRHYEPAAPVLVKFLDFRRPVSHTEEIFHGLSQELFPAEQALVLIGKRALPEVLREIESDSASARARENAIAVWMEIHKYERPRGIALLKQEERTANQGATRQRLTWALQKALKYCVANEAEACRQATVNAAS